VTGSSQRQRPASALVRPGSTKVPSFGQRLGGPLWPVYAIRRKHPAQSQRRLQSDGSGGEIPGFFDRGVDHVDGGRPPMGVALFGRQFTKHSHSIAKGRDDAVVANQLERQGSGAQQSCYLSGSPWRGIGRVAGNILARPPLKLYEFSLQHQN
jgi:hypothetical protein